MDSGLYAAYSGLLARTQALDLAANNLANAGTSGFRSERETFRGVMADSVSQTASQVGGAVNSYGVMGASSLSSTQGQISPTGNPLDLAIQGSAFFAIQMPNGVRYTRDGAFQVSAAGVLTTKTGATVLDAKGKSIKVPTGAVAVGSDGSISVTTPEGSAVVGQVGLANLGANGAKEAEGAGIYKAAEGAVPAAATDSTVRSGALEGANQDSVSGTMQLMLMQRQAEMMQRAISVFDNEFDKTATEQLSRV
jgi:flagellar basal-body rod protein FlgF